MNYASLWHILPEPLVQRVVRFKGTQINIDDGSSTLFFEPQEIETKRNDKKPLTYQQLEIKRMLVHLVLDYGEFKKGTNYPDAGVNVMTKNSWVNACKEANLSSVGITPFLKAKNPHMSNPMKIVGDLVKKGHLAKHPIEQEYWLLKD